MIDQFGRAKMERCNAAYKKQVRLACYDALERRGFTRFRKESVDWPIENGFHCWVGLNTALYPEYVAINPFCGIHAVTIERLWTSMDRGQAPTKYNRAVATYAIYLGEIAQHERVFQFWRNTNVSAEADRLADLYVAVGLPFARSLASYAALLPHLKDRAKRLGAFPQRTACCLFLMGQVEEACAFTTAFQRDQEAYFGAFARPFLRMIKESQGKGASNAGSPG